MTQKVYIGINDNFHDPAICVLNHNGELLFCEGSERFLQYKRAMACPPDLDFYLQEVLLEKLGKGKYDVIIASSWSRRRYLISKILDAFGVFSYDSRSFFRKQLKKRGVHRSFHYGSLRAAAALAQSGSGVFKLFNKWDENSTFKKISFEHHLCHIANATMTSPEKNGVGLVIDGGGEGTAISFYKVQNGVPKRVKKVNSPFSLGTLYSLSTNAIGYSAHKGEEWKIMGLAPYGKLHPGLNQMLRDIFRVKGRKYSTKTTILGKYEGLIQEFIRKENISSEDAAATVQNIFQEYLFQLVDHAMELVPNQDVTFISGGSALNSSAIGALAESYKFKQIVVPTAPADDGNALGAAVLAYRKVNGALPAWLDWRTPYTGSEITNTEIERYAVTSGLPFKKVADPAKEAAKLLCENKIIGWIQGQAEFGPRALGNRSILAHPGFAENKDRINAVVKFREHYRPFAPSILHDYGDAYFEHYSFSPYMEKTLTFRESMRNKVPAVVHVNNTGRLQSVTKELNPVYFELIQAFHDISGIPMVVNTSYNVMGKPIAHSLNDVMAVYLNSAIDALVINDFVLERK